MGISSVAELLDAHSDMRRAALETIDMPLRAKFEPNTLGDADWARYLAIWMRA